MKQELKEKVIDNTLIDILDEIDKEQEKIKVDNFDKSYDPYIPLELITPIIKKADLYSNLYAFSISSMFLVFAIFLGSITFTASSETLRILSIVFLFGSFIFLVFLLALAGFKLIEYNDKLVNLRLKYFDKSLINKLLENRDKKDNLGAMIFTISFIIGILFTLYSIIVFNTEFLFIPLFLSLWFGLFIYLRTASRKMTLEKLINTIQK